MTTMKNAGQTAGEAAALPNALHHRAPNFYAQTKIFAHHADVLLRIGQEAAPGMRVLLEMLAHDETEAVDADEQSLLNGFQRGALMDLLMHMADCIETAAQELAQHIAKAQEDQR